MERTQGAAVYFAAVKLVADEAARQHEKFPGEVRGSLHAALSTLSASLSRTLGRRVAIQIAERDGAEGP